MTSVSSVTRHHTHHMPPHTSHVTTHVTCHHTRHMSPHTSHVTAHVTCHHTRHMSPHTAHVTTHVTCHHTRHMSPHTSHVITHVTCHHTRSRHRFNSIINMSPESWSLVANIKLALLARLLKTHSPDLMNPNGHHHVSVLLQLVERHETVHVKYFVRT